MKQPVRRFFNVSKHYKIGYNKQMIVLFTKPVFHMKGPWKSLVMSTDHVGL